MVYIFVASYAEAEPVIRHLGLKQEKMEFGFYIYIIEKYKMKLVITGEGVTEEAVSSMLAYDCNGKNKDNIALINFGTCVGNDKVGKTYLCNKIIDNISGRIFYPDILYRHNYPERYIVTETNDFINNNYQDILYQDGLHDMDAAIIYQAGSHFLSPQNMSFIKVISNTCWEEKIQAKELKEIMEIEIEYFLEYLMKWIEWDRQKELQANQENKIDKQELEQLCQDLHCSESMKKMMEQYITYCLLAGIDYQTIFQEMRKKKELPCKDRREGKKKIGELKRKLL